MQTTRNLPRIAGSFIIIGIVAGVLSVVPAIEEIHFLSLVALHDTQVISGAFFQFLMIPAYIGFALCLYPVVKTTHETLSLGFVGFRFITVTFHFIGVILLPLTLLLSQEFVSSGMPEASYFQTLGDLLRTARDLVNHVAVIIPLMLGDMLLFFMLYQSRIIPRLLTIWGVLGSGLAMFASFLILVDVVDVITPLYLTLNAPLALHSLIFAIWLITKGFNTTALSGGYLPQNTPVN